MIAPWAPFGLPKPARLIVTNIIKKTWNKKKELDNELKTLYLVLQVDTRSERSVRYGWFAFENYCICWKLLLRNILIIVPQCSNFT